MTIVALSRIGLRRKTRPAVIRLALSFVALVTGATIALAQNFNVAPLPQIMAQPTQRIVEIQGGGLMFLDAHEIEEMDYNVVIRAFQNNATQRWILTDTGAGWTIQQQSSGRFLDAHEVADRDYRVVTRPQQNNNTQLFRLVDYGGGFYTIQQISSGRFLEPYLDQAHDFQVVTRPERPGDNLQVWRIVDR